jgi:hypothetical protein
VDIASNTASMALESQSTYLSSNTLIDYSTVACIIAPLVFIFLNHRKRRQIQFPIR